MKSKQHRGIGDDKFVIVVLFIIFFLLFLNRLSAQPYIYTSNDDTSPSSQLWSDEDTWTITNDESWLPRTPQASWNDEIIDTQVDQVDVYGYTYRIGNISTSHDVEINIYDTLYVDGNLTLSSSGSMNISSNGLLIVKGDLNITNGAEDLNSQGTVVVTGDLNISNGTGFYNSSETYVYGTTFTSNDGEIGDGNSTCNSDDPCDPEDYTNTESDLQNDDPVLYDFVDTGNANTILPVTLNEFTAKTGGTYVDLNWSTFDEENFDYFAVEHSTDGNSFSIISKVSGAGFSKNLRHYNFQHISPALGWNYYRLTAVDFDGSKETFKPVSAFVEGNEQNRIYPNPGNGNAFNYAISVSHDNFESADLSIRNLEGKLVYQTTINHFQGKISPDKLEKGIYLVRIQRNANTWNFKYVVK